MSVTVTHVVPRGTYPEVDSGFCYCRRNTASVPLKKAENKTTLDLATADPVLATSVEFGNVPAESSQYHEIILVNSNYSKNYPGGIKESFEEGMHYDHTAFRFVYSVSTLPGINLNSRKCSSPSKQSFRIYFEPKLPGVHFVQTFKFLVGEEGKEVPVFVTCRGNSFGPAVCLSMNQINFGAQYFQDETKRRVKLNNLSECEAKFHFDVDNTRSAFKICPTAGVIPPQSILTVELTFYGPKPQIYYKRIICLVLHQQPQYLDLFGICVPRPFLAPLEGIDVGISSFGTQFLPLPSSDNEEYFVSNRSWGIYMDPDQIDFGSNHVGTGSPRSARNESVNLYSNLPYDVVLEWSPDPTEVFKVTPQRTILLAKNSTVFSVRFHPTFPNTFYSGQLDCFVHPTNKNWSPQFGPPWALISEEEEEEGELEDIFENEEELENIREENVATIASAHADVQKNCQVELGLPLCLTLRVVGHTFRSMPPPVTHVKFPSQIVMDSTEPTRKTCRTICVKNGSDLPVHFDTTAIEEHGVFRVRPNKGVVPGNFHSLLLVSMTPNSPEPLLYVQNSIVTLNLRERNLVNFIGLTETPTINFVQSSDGKDILKDGIEFPMCVPGFESEAVTRLVNPTRFHYKFSFEPDPEAVSDNVNDEVEGDRGIFSVVPSTGYIQPYETTEVVWKFRPVELEEYSQGWKGIFSVRKDTIQPREIQPHFQHTFFVAGAGENCNVEASPEDLDFGLVELYSRRKLEFTIHNKGKATVTIYLKAIHEQWLAGFPDELIVIDPPNVTVGDADSAIVTVTARPTLMKLEKFYITYSLTPEIDVLDPDLIRLIHIRVVGDHPSLKVTDISQIAQQPVCDAGFCWSLFSLDTLNKYLALSPLAIAQEGEWKSEIPPTVTFDFPASSTGSEPVVFTILLKNTSKLETGWELYTEPPKKLHRFLFGRKKKEKTLISFHGDHPKNSEFMTSLWNKKMLEVGEKLGDKVGDRELREKFETSKGMISLFKVHPVKAHVKPNDYSQITFRYLYKNVGLHEKYILLRVEPAMFVWIKLRGRTCQPNVSSLQHFYNKDKKAIIPVSLKDLDPPIQLLWLYNGGKVPANFVVCPEPFENCVKENYGHSAFECVTKNGVIPPRSWGAIKVRFAPIENREYNLDMVVKWDEGELIIPLHGTPLLRQTTLVHPSEFGLNFTELNSIIIDPYTPINFTPSQVTIKESTPTGSEETSMVILTNLSESRKISFYWPEETPIDGGGCITFRPQSGTLSPNSQEVCQIVIHAGNTSISLTTLIRCTIVDEVEVQRNVNKLTKWETGKKFLMCRNITPEQAEAKLVRKYGPRPITYEPSTKILSITAYITSTFGMLDYATVKEKAMRTPIPPCKPLPVGKTNILQDQSLPRLQLPEFAAELSGEILTSVLWDIVNSKEYEEFMKIKGCRRAPNFHDYFKSELEKGRKRRIPLIGRGDFDEDQLRNATFEPFDSHDVLKEVMFNLLEEMNDEFTTEEKGNPFELQSFDPTRPTI